LHHTFIQLTSQDTPTTCRARCERGSSRQTLHVFFVEKPWRQTHGPSALPMTPRTSRKQRLKSLVTKPICTRRFPFPPGSLWSSLNTDTGHPGLSRFLPFHRVSARFYRSSVLRRTGCSCPQKISRACRARRFPRSAHPRSPAEKSSVFRSQRRAIHYFSTLTFHQFAVQAGCLQSPSTTINLDFRAQSAIVGVVFGPQKRPFLYRKRAFNSRSPPLPPSPPPKSRLCNQRSPFPPVSLRGTTVFNKRFPDQPGSRAFPAWTHRKQLLLGFQAISSRKPSSHNPSRLSPAPIFR